MRSLAERTRLALLAFGVIVLAVTPAGAVRTTLTHTAVATGADAQVLAANGQRNYLYLENLDTAGTNHIFCKFGATAVANQGIRLLSTTNGLGRMHFVEKVPTAALRCVAGAGTPTILIAEGVGP